MPAEPGPVHAPDLHDGGHEPFTRGHRAVVEALRARDARTAGDGMADDIRRTRLLLQPFCEARAAAPRRAAPQPEAPV